MGKIITIKPIIEMMSSNLLMKQLEAEVCNIQIQDGWEYFLTVELFGKKIFFVHDIKELNIEILEKIKIHDKIRFKLHVFGEFIDDDIKDVQGFEFRTTIYENDSKLLERSLLSKVWGRVKIIDKKLTMSQPFNVEINGEDNFKYIQESGLDDQIVCFQINAVYISILE